MKLVAWCARTQASHLLLQLRRPLHRHTGAPQVRDRRIRPIGGQLQQLWHPGQGILPVSQLRSDAAVAVAEITQPLPLPQRVIDILHSQRRPTGGIPATPAGVSHPQITHQRSDRPAIGGDMVHRDDQHMVVVADAEKPCPQRDLGGQIKWMRAAAQMASSSRAAGQPVTSMTCQPKSARSAATTSCLGIPSTAGNSVRRLSWRLTTSASASPNASASRCPCNRNAAAML